MYLLTIRELLYVMETVVYDIIFFIVDSWWDCVNIVLSCCYAMRFFRCRVCYFHCLF